MSPVSWYLTLYNGINSRLLSVMLSRESPIGSKQQKDSMHVTISKPCLAFRSACSSGRKTQEKIALANLAACSSVYLSPCVILMGETRSDSEVDEDDAWRAS
uniref:Uncharacterized protein n=1 Tax=Oryza brachyantha TaxID=4533 RepID=J3MXZ8_ORYBR